MYALTRATCAQAEYRVAMGPEFFIEDQYGFVAGPDFSRRGELAYIGPDRFQGVGPERPMLRHERKISGSWSLQQGAT